LFEILREIDICPQFNHMSERKIEVEYESYNRQELLLQSKRITAIVKNDEENLVNIKILG